MKKFWNILKKILTVASMLAGAALFVVVLTSAVQTQKELICKNLQVKIDYDSGMAFLSEGEIKDHLNYFNGKELFGEKLSEIDLGLLEREVEKNPFVDNAEVFVNQRQCITVTIVQKRPILRILNSDGVGYYLSEKNERIPLNNKFTSHVAIATGNVEMHRNPKRDSSVQAALYKLIQYVRKDEFLNALVDQVYVTEAGEMDLMPKINGHVIHFGKVSKDMDEKFLRLKTFYKEGFAKVGWDKYRSIDLRYMNQVVCEKNEPTEATL